MSIYKDVKFQFLEIAAPTTSDKALKVSGTAEITGALTLSSNLAVVGNTTITGNLTVDGTTTTVNSTVVDVVDPIMTIGANASDDNKDRGLVFKYNDGAAKLGFIGYDNSLSQFSMMTTVTNSSEVVSGTLGTLQIAGISATSSTFDLDSANAMSLNSSGGEINVGNDAVAQAINIGTGAAARTITVGNATGATALDVNLGTGGLTVDCTDGGAISLDANGAPSNFTLASTAAADDLTIAVTGATDSSLVLSSTGTGGDALQVTSSAGGMDITSAGVLDITTSAGNSNINIDPHGSGTLALGSADNTAVTVDAVAITLTSVDALSLTDGTATLSLGGTGATSLSAATTVALDCTGAMSLNSSGGEINVGNDAVAQAINIGTGGAARTITIGNATGATAVAITAGTGGVPITSDTATTGHAVSITADALTSGSALDITSTSAGKTTGGLVNIAQTGATTTQEAPSMTVSTSATTHANAGIASFTGNSLTVGDAVSISANALTSGSALDISATNASLTGPVINITGGSATANEYTAFTPIYQQINSVQRGNIKFSWTASAAASEVDVGVDLPFTTGVCVVTDIFIITTNATNTPTIDLGLLSTETNGDADGFLDGVTQSATGVQSVYTNDFKGAFNTDSGDSIPTRWNCPFNASTGQARSISMTLSATGSVGTIIMEYIAIDV